MRTTQPVSSCGNGWALVLVSPWNRAWASAVCNPRSHFLFQQGDAISDLASSKSSFFLPPASPLVKRPPKPAPPNSGFQQVPKAIHRYFYSSFLLTASTKYPWFLTFPIHSSPLPLSHYACVMAVVLCVMHLCISAFLETENSNPLHIDSHLGWRWVMGY